MVDERESISDLESIARRLTYRPESRLEHFHSLPLSVKSAVFNLLSSTVRQEILAQLSFNDTVELLDHLDPRRVHQILSKMKDKKRRDRLVSRIKSDRYEKLEYFLQFHPQASISLFHSNYVYLPEETTVGDTAGVIEDHLRTTGKTPLILVSRGGELCGEVALSTLVKERNTSKLRNFVKPVKSVKYNHNPAEVLAMFVSSPHEKIILTDNDDSVIGLIYSDDVIDLMDEQPASTLYSFAGVEASERPFDGIFDKVKGRYRWLIINLATCFLAGGVVALFNDTVETFVALAIFMPMIAGMGGNSSTQTLAVMIRGIAVGEINLKSSYSAIVREMGAGLFNGICTAAIMFPIAIFFGLPMAISLIAGVAIVFNMIVGAFFGSFTPLLMKHFGKDPATSSGIFVSTATDVLGLLFLLGMATLILL